MMKIIQREYVMRSCRYLSASDMPTRRHVGNDTAAQQMKPVAVRLIQSRELGPSA